MLKTTIGTSLLAASLLVSGATAATAQADPTLGPYGYGAIKLGMTVKQAKATGLFKKFVRDSQGCLEGYLKKFPTRKGPYGLEYDVYFSSDKKVGSISARKGMTTPEGIKIGSTLRQLKAAYPRMKQHIGNHPYDSYYSINVPANKKAEYTFGVNNGKVAVYSLNRNRWGCD